ncbi:aminoglycoside phosphotransferase family protein [Streptomyces aurantiacus]|uniref:aminoglycoside phosphotransferase family protein n=1 Tax=Streptomyces aurantiacus TaxID=47760 RepID=UPI0027D891AE|nr:aminoglycoside phosphotransferase family protein [Streptomyces aurantiacus]
MRASRGVACFHFCILRKGARRERRAMSPESDSYARLWSVEASGNADVVEGPLRGYHHETYVFPLPGAVGAGQSVRWKCREPYSDLLWFDRRCFASEEQLLTALSGRISGIPDIFQVSGTGLQRFIEGGTLGSLHKSTRKVPDDLFDQIIGLFGELTRVTPETLPIDRMCKLEDRPPDGDTDGFLERLIQFAEQRVYVQNLERFKFLFEALGVDGDSFKSLRKHVSGLKERPFCLLHADLHRENFIVDSERKLWTIDWELAMFGDPLYDLATHLYLMRYPLRQERRMAEQWCTTVEKIRPGSSNGVEVDLPRLLDYKRAQSVFTDVIREALSLDAEPDHRRRLARAGAKLRRILADAALPLGLDSVPSAGRIVTALEQWHHDHASDRSSGWQ